MKIRLTCKNISFFAFIILLSIQTFNCIARQIPIPKERLGVKLYESKKLSDKNLTYLLYLPNAYYNGNRNKLPLVVYFHDREKQSIDLQSLKQKGLPYFISEKNQNFPFVMLAPILPNTKVSWNTNDLQLLIEEIESDFPIDIDRIYLTGIGFGGNVTWNLAVDYPEKFAAIAPISAWGDTSRICKLRDLNVWAFHGAKDTTVLPEQTYQVVERLEFCNPNVKYTIYPQQGEEVWKEVYNSSKFLDWLLENKRNEVKKVGINKKKSKFNKANPLKVLVIGDSIGISLTWGFNEFVQSNYHIEQDNFAKISTGLLFPKLFDWKETLQGILSQKKYDLGIVLIGANDFKGMNLDSGFLGFQTDFWKEEYKRRIKAIVEIFRKSNMNLYWIGLPPMGSAKYHKDTRYINSCFEEVGREEKFIYISTDTILGDENGDYQKYLPYRGKQTLMRAEDNIHLTIVAAKKMTKVILKKIFEDYEFLE